MASLARRLIFTRQFCAYLGEFGRGAGKSGGCGGTIRNAGGAFGRLEAAREEEYFFHLQEEQMKEMKDHMEEGKKEDLEDDAAKRYEKLVKAAAEQRAKLSNMRQVE